MLAKFKKIKITSRKANQWFYSLAIILSLFFLAYLSLFLYKNFYQTIAQSKEIIILKEKVAMETVDMDKFNQIMENLNQKNKLKKIESLNNPFD